MMWPLFAWGMRALPNILPGIGGALTGILPSSPKFEDEATVEVVGQPGATKQQLYYLALAVAFSLVRRYDAAAMWTGVPPGLLMLEYDASDNWVRATVRYRTNTLTSGIANGQVLSDAVLFKGPNEVIEGGPFNFTGGVLAGGLEGRAQIAIPGGKAAPILPFLGKTILTTYPRANPGLVPSLNPKPTGDKRSRGSAPFDTGQSGQSFGDLPLSSDALVPLVYAALSDPGSENLMKFPGAQQGVEGR